MIRVEPVYGERMVTVAEGNDCASVDLSNSAPLAMIAGLFTTDIGRDAVCDDDVVWISP